MRSLRSVPIVTAWLLLCAACSSRPDEQLQLARTAMERAMEERAADFAPTDWSSAKEVWDEAQSALSKESFAEARTLLLRAKSRFEKAHEIAKSKRADFLREVEGLQRDLDTRFESYRSGLSVARLSAANKKKFGEVSRNIELAVQKVKDDLQGGDYVKARKSAEEAMRLIFESERNLTAAR
jgi:hypothetical protein